MILTYRYRIKGGFSRRKLSALSKSVNFVWNYCNETSFNAIRNHSDFLSGFDLNYLTAGTGKEIGLHSQTVQAIGEEYATRRIQFKKRKLRWRASSGSKKSLGWVPFKSTSVKVDGNKATYAKQAFKFWKSRDLPGKIKCGSFSQDAQGHWYINLVVEAPLIETSHAIDAVGVDLGLKDTAVLSDGSKVENPRIFLKYENKLAGFQRHRKKRQAQKLSAKIKNIRKDFLHKETLRLARKYKTIFVGNVSGKFLQSSHGKSSQDASTGMFRQILKYKAIRHQGLVVDVSEFASTVTCCSCLKKTGPSGPSDLRIRGWICSECLSQHDRDVNAAKNILRIGLDALRAANVA